MVFVKGHVVPMWEEVPFFERLLLMAERNSL